MNSMFQYLNINVDYSLKKDKDGYQFQIDIPGFTKEEIKINADGSQILISAKNDSRQYEKSYIFDENLDLSSSKANLKNGVLTLNIPEKKRKAPSIPISD